jgi:hypothetical protein
MNNEAIQPRPYLKLLLLAALLGLISAGIFAEMMTEFGRTGRFDCRHAPGPVIAIAVIVGLLATVRLSMTPVGHDSQASRGKAQTQELST